MECFAPPKTWVLDLHWVKVMFYADFEMLHSINSHNLTNCLFFKYWKKKKSLTLTDIHQTFCQKSLSAFWGIQWGTFKDTKTLLGKIFYKFCHNSWKKYFLLLQDFLHTIFLIFSTMLFFTKKHIKTSATHNVGGAKNSKSHTKKCLPKKWQGIWL